MKNKREFVCATERESFLKEYVIPFLSSHVTNVPKPDASLKFH